MGAKTQKESFVVTEEQAGTRLDLLLPILVKGYSRTLARKMLDSGLVKVNSEIEYRPNYKVRTGDRLAVRTDVVPKKKRFPPFKVELDVLYRDEDVVMVNKPAGMPVHPVSHKQSNTLINALEYSLRDVVTEYGVGLVNRIDTETSGIVVAALSARGAWHYSKLFAEGKVEKEYLALVYGNWEAKYGRDEIKQTGFMRKSREHKGQEVNQSEGRFADTDFSLLGYNNDKKLSLIRVIPHTGRTHQIRVQLANMGFPVVGDKLYGGMQAARLMLHSYKLSLSSYGGGKISMTANIPEEFSKLFKTNEPKISYKAG